MNDIRFKSPYAVSLGIGFSSGLLLALASYLGTTLSFFFIALIPIAAPLFAVLGYSLSKQLASFFASSEQILRFALVGALSTSIELALLNILFAATGVTAGFLYSLFKTFTFLIALVNGYWFNKNWTFPPTEKSIALEFGTYTGANIIGLILNVGTASFVVNVVTTPAGISPELWANIGAIIAVFVTMIWNFLNYKFFVFKT